MNYLIMKSIVDATIAHFACKSCGSRITDRDVQIIGMGAQAVNMEITCPHCKASGVLKAEINVVGDAQDFAALMEGSETPAARVELSDAHSQRQVPAPIRDEDILALRERLKGSASVEDLLS